MVKAFCLIGFLGNLLSFRWTKGNELITELKLKQTQIPEIVKDAHIALRYQACLKQCDIAESHSAEIWHCEKHLLFNLHPLKINAFQATCVKNLNCMI